MAKTVLIGIEPRELPWLRVLVALLRHRIPASPGTRPAGLFILVEWDGQAGAGPALHAMPKSDKLHGFNGNAAGTFPQPYIAFPLKVYVRLRTYTSSTSTKLSAVDHHLKKILVIWSTCCGLFLDFSGSSPSSS